MRKIISAFLVALLTFGGFAQTYKLQGKVGDKYPVVIELEQGSNGSFHGRYAYLSTLKSQGDKPCSWLTITPAKKNPSTEWVVRNCNGEVVEQWHNANFAYRSTLTADMTNYKGKSYKIKATVNGQPSAKSSLSAFFKSHLGDYAYEFNMFDSEKIKTRLINMMGASNFKLLKKTYETQTPIEYNSGMYWASGFMAHQCCDPVALWAYDADTNNFYVWIRKDNKAHWWSETGTVPYKFSELVATQY